MPGTIAFCSTELRSLVGILGNVTNLGSNSNDGCFPRVSSGMMLDFFIIGVMCCTKPFNDCLVGHYDLIVLLLEAK